MEVLRGANIEKGSYVEKGENVEKRGFTKDGETFYLKLKGKLRDLFYPTKERKTRGLDVRRIEEESGIALQFVTL